MRLTRYCLLVAGTLALPAIAGAEEFTTRAAFDLAAGATTTETFQSCTATGLADGQSLSSGAPGPCGAIVAGVTFAPPAGGNFYIAGPVQSANPTIALGIDLPLAGIATITFAAGATAFGADFFQNFGGGSQSGNPAAFTLGFYAADNTLLSQTNLAVVSGAGAFYGLTSAAAFSYVQVSQAGGYAVFDNVAFGNGAVPEPASWALLIVGFALTGFAARRRRGALAA